IATLYAHIATGQWAGVVPHPWLRSFPQDSHLRAAAIAGPPVEPGVALVTSAAEPGSVLAGAFAEAAAGLRLDDLFDRGLPG
ncbi:MAG TPA: hypothetical protein VHF06_35650, partial [Pseudonocardiaceae bacterium]|nr:hypothetical protein [Pseudonocardiaceae bacterium]